MKIRGSVVSYVKLYFPPSAGGLKKKKKVTINIIGLDYYYLILTRRSAFDSYLRLLLFLKTEICVCIPAIVS